MSEPTIKVPNEDVLRAGIAHAELDLNHWDQGSWAYRREEGERCGTTACLAGHILLARGVPWEELLRHRSGIPGRAMNALGFRFFDPQADNDSGRFYRGVFGMVREGVDNFSYDVNVGLYLDSVPLRTEPAAFKIFKERITELTGVEL